MAATVKVHRLTGATPTETDVTGSTPALSTSDDPQPGTSNPVPRPAAGVTRSYWASFQLEITVAPASLINNIRVYTAGTPGTGRTYKGQSAGSYVAATGTEGTAGDQLSVANHAGLSAEPVDIATWTEGAPKTLAGSSGALGPVGDLIVLQGEVDATAAGGESDAVTVTWLYDEV